MTTDHATTPRPVTTMVGYAFIFTMIALIVGAYFVTSSVLGRLDSIDVSTHTIKALAARSDCAREISDEQNRTRAVRERESTAVIDTITKMITAPVADRPLYLDALNQHERALEAARAAVDALPSFVAEVNKRCPSVSP